MRRRAQIPTLTDSQIRELLARAEASGNKHLVRLCKVALDDGPTYIHANTIRDARERCAVALVALDALDAVDALVDE